MSDIFDDIAKQWDTLGSKQKSYIATTLAGTRQQNYFLALMNDMAQGVEGGSRAYELYAGALNAAGTAAQKYAVWQESVTAAQNRLTAAMQDFYALLDAEWMKGFYDGMAGLVEIITAGTDALGGWNLLIPLIAAGVTGLIAVIYKAVAAVKAMSAALASGAGLATALSGGAVGAIIAAVAGIAAVATMIAGAAKMANDMEKTDYSGTISSVEGYRDRIGSLVSELETLAGKTRLSAEEQRRADEIMETLSGTSLSMKRALEGGGEGFDTLGDKAAAARGELERTDQALRSLNAADALQSLRDADRAYADAIREAQERAASTSRYGEIRGAYDQYMAEHPEGTYGQYYHGGMGIGAVVDENFFSYAQKQSRTGVAIWASGEEKAAARERMAFWAAIVEEMKQLGIDANSSVEEINNKMLEFDIAATSYMQASGERLSEAWQPVFDNLRTVMTDGTQFSQLPSFMQEAAANYYEAYIGAIDQQAELAEGDLMAMAADLTGYVDGMMDYVEANADFAGLVGRFDELAQGPHTQETVDELNALLPLINEYISAYNDLTEGTEDDIPLLPEFTLEGLQAAREEIEAAGDAVAALDTTDLYKNLALAREEANGFASVLAKIGEGEGQIANLHDAVLLTAEELAHSLGITDANAIGAIGDKLLEGLYDTYPEIADYVDTATGMLLEGWQEELADATDPWAELFETAKLEDALKAARRDMAALDTSELWAELMKPDGKGLYEYAEDWARTLIPEGTAAEIHAQAQAFVEAFFAMFTDIDTTILDADGRIAAGMEGIVATMRQAVHAAQQEATKLETAYKTLHAERIARDEAIQGLTTMAGLAKAGDAAGVAGTFEALSTEAIDAIADAMPEMIDKLNDGTCAAADFEAAILRLREAETQAGKDAWQDYFKGTADGLKQQSALWAQAMRSIIAEVSGADDKAAALYAELMKLSDGGLDIGGMLNQYGALAVQLLNGTVGADELYAALVKLENLSGLQMDLESAGALNGAAQAIDPAQSGYDPAAALEAYALLEAEYVELAHLQRGSNEYIERARELTRQTTAAVFEQAAAYGVVTDLQAKAAQYAAAGQRERKFDRAGENSYAGGVDFLTNAARQAEEAGKDVSGAWNDALSELDEAGILEQFAQIAGEARRGMIARRKEPERRRSSATTSEERHRGKAGFPEGIQAALRSGVSNRGFETSARRSGKPPLFCYLRKLL